MVFYFLTGWAKSVNGSPKTILVVLLFLSASNLKKLYLFSHQAFKNGRSCLLLCAEFNPKRIEQDYSFWVPDSETGVFLHSWKGRGKSLDNTSNYSFYWKYTKAPQAAGKIHTDFEKGFISAEVMKFEDFKEHGSESAVKVCDF